MKTMLRKSLRPTSAGAIVLVPLALTWSSAVAYDGLDSYALTREEVSFLPEFCRHTQLIIQNHGSPAEQRAWVQRTGNAFLHMHHYCIAVIAIFRSFRPTNTPADRNGFLQFAVGNLLYVVRNSEPNYVFMPEVYYRLGSAYRRMGRLEEAAKALEMAIEGFPKHTSATIELAQVHQANANPAAAERVLREALSRTPDSIPISSALQGLSAPRPEKR
jgi:tetratricopeptide (TPR) repeat protein